MTIAKNPRAVVTGGAGGLGRAFCVELGKRGGKVLVSDRDLSGAEETARLVAQAGGFAHAVRCDVTNRDEVAALLPLADAQLGGVDLIVNNAGVAVSGPVGEIPLADWEWIVNINLWGVIYGCHTFVPRFKQQRSGHVLNVASAAGLLSAPEMAPYNVTKAAVVALTETLAGELPQHGVHATALCPTFFQTNIMASSRSDTLTAGLDQIVEKRMKDSKLQAEDVARIALQACDDDQVYAVPMLDGRWSWRLKRLAPEQYFKMMPRVIGALNKQGSKAKHG